MLNGRDIVILVRLAAVRDTWSFRALGKELSIDPAALHRSLQRLARAKLVDQDRSVERPNAEEFLIHGLRFLVPCELGAEARGVPTAWGAPPLGELLAGNDELVPVWPDPLGSRRGPAIEPIDRAVPSIARAQPQLGEWFALLDALRVGRARDRRLAASEIRDRIWASGP